MDIIEAYESAVRSYSRGFPTVFTTAKGARLTDRQGHAYIDFFAGAGALNYGHNDEVQKAALLAYIESDGITHSLDMATDARERFLETFHDLILAPRGLAYKVMFPGPTGTNSVEAALKLARKVTGRRTIVSFTNGFHGMTLGALAVTGNAFKRAGAGTSLHDTAFMPFDKFLGEGRDTLDAFEAMLEGGSSGLDHPAAVIVETVQGEGGINAASMDWLRRLDALCKRHDIRLILDDVQAGCGRTGTFFSFEPAGITPDFVCLSKSIGGYGLPLALVLVKPEYDRFAPGEHNGTFRGHNPALVTARAALEAYWRDNTLAAAVKAKAETVHARLARIAANHPELNPEVRGRGLMAGIALNAPGAAEAVAAECFANGLVIETSGAEDEVVKILCPLTIPDADLNQGLDILSAAVDTVAPRFAQRASNVA